MTNSESQVRPLSPALRAVVERLYADSDALCQVIYEEIRGTVSDYRLSTDGGFPDDLKMVLGWHIGLWYEALLQARMPSEASVAKAEVFARRRAHQGISLDSMLRAFRIGSGGVWRLMIEDVRGNAVLENELLHNVSPYLLHHFDVISHHVAQAYMDEQFQQASWRDRVRGELWSVVSARREDADAFSRYCKLLYLDAMAPHVAIVFAVQDVTAETRLDSHTFRRIVREMGMDGDNSMFMRYRDHFVVWAPSGRGELLVDGDRRVATCAQQVIDRVERIERAGIGLPGAGVIDRVERIERAGIGLPGAGAAGWWTSLEQAFRAIECGRERMLPVTRYSHILLDEAIAHSDSTQRFLDALLERLNAEPHLLETLREYFRHQQQRKAVASELGVHPNTLDHRLRRIETLLGGSFGDVTWLATLSAALRRQRR